MKKSLILILALIGALAACNTFANSADVQMVQRDRLNFNQGWKFIRKNVPAAVKKNLRK